MDYFEIISVVIILTCLPLVFVFLTYGRGRLKNVGAAFNLAVTVWGIGCFLFSKAGSIEEASLGWKIAFSGAIFIPILLYQIVIIISKSTKKTFLYFSYFTTVIGLVFIWCGNMVFNNWRPLFSRGIYYNHANLWYCLELINWTIIAIVAHFELFFYAKSSSGLNRIQAKYLFWGSLVGFIGGALTLLPAFGVEVYPISNFTIPIYAITTAYAMLRYRLLDISIIITRSGIFIGVYSVVLGIPFAFAFGFKNRLHFYLGDSWWLGPMGMLTVLATVGPFIYLYIQKRAEESLLKDQRRYQTTLSQASAGMGRIKDLNRLLDLIVYIITRAVRLDHSAVYIFDKNKMNYRLGSRKGQPSIQTLTEISEKSVLVRHLIVSKSSIVYEEIKRRVQDYNDQHLAKVEDALKQVDAALVVPSLIEDRLLAIIVLGKKKSGKLFGEDDLSVFSILANQAALAIENAQFYEDVKTTQEQLFQAEKMATIGTMADGLSHQINNRLHALGFIAGDALDTIKMKKDAPMSDDMKGVMEDLERSLVRIQENVLQGGEVVQGLLRYTRKGEKGYAPVEVDKLVTAALEMAQFKIKTHEMKILREYDKSGPKINGNFTQLQEVFFNMIDNAYDAMMQRKNEQKEPGFLPLLRIQTHIQDDRILVKFIDNGIGVKLEDYQKIFTPFFTTKLSSKKGTGLGLYVIKKIVEDNHHGKVTFNSKYLEGTTITLNLPIAY